MSLCDPIFIFAAARPAGRLIPFVATMSLPDTIVIFGVALVIFGPKKLPEIGRQIGKLVVEFRRASNEFKMQIEEELRTAEQVDRQKKLAAQSIAPSAPVAGDAEAVPIGEVAPVATVEAIEPPPSLTVKPPATGITESAESPFQPYAASEEGSVEEGSAEEGSAENVSSNPPLLNGDRPADSDRVEEQTTNHHG